MVYLRNKTDYSHAVLYEDLIGDPRGKAQQMLDDLEIPADQARLAIRGMELDSQNDMFTGLGKKKRKLLTPEDWAISDSIMEEIGSPIRHDMSLDQLRSLLKSQ